MAIPAKPRESTARRLLKNLKDGFDNPRFEIPVETLVWAVLYGPVKEMRAYAGEFLHQIALYYERNGRIDLAFKFYRMSEARMEDNPLGLARTLRDHGMCIVTHGDDPLQGLGLIERALDLHRQDPNNTKGYRQELITQSKLYRAQILLRTPERSKARKNLVKLVEDPFFDTFYVRDRKVIVDFLIERTTPGLLRDEVLKKRADIYLERRQPGLAATSYIQRFINAELTLAYTVVRRLVRWR